MAHPHVHGFGIPPAHLPQGHMSEFVSLEQLQQWALEAVDDLRTMHPESDARGTLPEALEAEIAGCDLTTPEGCLALYALCRAENRIAVAGGETQKMPAEVQITAELIVQRHPIGVTLSNGHVIGVTSKSMKCKNQMAKLWVNRVWLTNEIKRMSARPRLSDIRLIEQAIDARDRLTARWVRLAMSPDATPTDDPNHELAPWVSDLLDSLTDDDLDQIGKALQVVCDERIAYVMRYMRSGDDGGSKELSDEEILKSGWAAWYSHVADKVCLPLDDVLSEDDARLRFQIRATQHTPAKKKESQSIQDIFGGS